MLGGIYTGGQGDKDSALGSVLCVILLKKSVTKQTVSEPYTVAHSGVSGCHSLFG